MIDVRRIPIIGNDIYQAGQVIDIVSQPCTPSPSILVNAFFANIPMLLWSLVKPSPEDYLTERLGRHHKRRRKNRITIKDFDVGPPPGKRGAAWVEFSAIKFIERIGWYLLVADATTDFAINWTSMAYRYSGCQDPLSGYASLRRITTQNIFNTSSDLHYRGRTYFGVERTSFAIGPDGRIEHVLPRVKPTEHLGQLVEVLAG